MRKLNNLPHVRHLAALTLVLAAILSSQASRATSNEITTEGVDEYIPSRCSWSPSLSNSVANNNGFRSTMITGDGFWAAGHNFQNSSVFDTDFYDPDRTNGNDYDTYWFDDLGNGIAYFTGHGICDGATNDLCTSTSQCNSPGHASGPATMPSSCKQGPPGSGFPSVGQGWCHYWTPRHMITCSSYSTHNDDVNYSQNLVKWGE